MVVPNGSWSTSVTSRYAGEPDPGPAVDLENRSLTKYKLIVEEVGGWGRYQDFLDVVADVADKHDVSIANVATRYVLEKPGVCAAIVGSRDTFEHVVRRESRRLRSSPDLPGQRTGQCRPPFRGSR
jgi:aryl-alcohol dehydrogenase-like predicted oxidoreductase